MFSQLFDHIVQEEQESDFDSHFQPITPEEGESRRMDYIKSVMDYIKSVCIQNPDGTWSSEGDVHLEGKGLDKFPVKFKSVGGDFNCSYNNLTSLEGAPEKVEGFFNCYSNQLFSLEGAPDEVGGYFYCSGNNLISLEGAPKEVGGDFYCSGNNLKTLEGAPKEVGGDFYYYNNSKSVEELKKTIDRPYI
jgi:hypothetical protein